MSLDTYCMYCGAGPLWVDRPDSPLRPRVRIHHVCPQKPPLTAEEGVAAVGGVVLMAMAIAANQNVVACPRCLKYASGRVAGMGIGSNDWLKWGEWLCMRCFDTEKARRESGHPYR